MRPALARMLPPHGLGKPLVAHARRSLASRHRCAASRKRGEVQSADVQAGDGLLAKWEQVPVKVAGRELLVPVPEATPQVAAALRSNPEATLAAAGLGVVAATYSVLHSVAALLQWPRALDERSTVAVAACRAEMAATREAVSALEEDLRRGACALAAREAQLSGTTAAAQLQAEAAHRALAGSQARVERLEGLAVALRESVATRGKEALAGLNAEQRRDMVERFQELRRQLESAQWHVEVAEGRASDLQQQLAALAGSSAALTKTVHELQDAAAQRAQAVLGVLSTVEAELTAALSRQGPGPAALPDVVDGLAKRVAAARSGIEATRSDVAEMAEGLNAAVAMWEKRQQEMDAQKRQHTEQQQLEQQQGAAAVAAAEQLLLEQQQAVGTPTVVEKPQSDAARKPVSPLSRPAVQRIVRNSPSTGSLAGTSQQKQQPAPNGAAALAAAAEAIDAEVAAAEAAAAEKAAAEAAAAERAAAEAAAVEAAAAERAAAEAAAAEQAAAAERAAAEAAAAEAAAAERAAAEAAAAEQAAAAERAAAEAAAAEAAAAERAAAEAAAAEQAAAAERAAAEAAAAEAAAAERAAAEAAAAAAEAAAAERAAAEAAAAERAAAEAAAAERAAPEAAAAEAAAAEAAAAEAAAAEAAAAEKAAAEVAAMRAQMEAMREQLAARNAAVEQLAQAKAKQSGGEGGTQPEGNAPAVPSMPKSSAGPAVVFVGSPGGKTEAPTSPDGAKGAGGPVPPAGGTAVLDDVVSLARSMLGSSGTSGGKGAAVAEAAATTLAAPARTVAVPKAPAEAGVLTLACAGAMTPSAKKIAAGSTGEDAFFVTASGRGGLGVADGVGGWTTEGIDSAAYACMLMAQCSHALEGPQPCHSALAALEYAQVTTKLPGSATVCLALLRPSGSLEVVNLGDSGLRVVRNGRVAWASRVQEHAWNCPYQLSHPKFLASTDTPEDADVSEVPLKPGDIVVAATDGLWDNLWEKEFLAVVKRAGGSAASGADAADRADAVARALVDAAAANATNPRYRGPWAVELESHGKVSGMALVFGARGGKVDDITAVVGVVC